MHEGRDEGRNILSERELAQVDVVLGRSDEVNQLPSVGLESRIVEDVEEIDVVRLGTEVLLEEIVDGAFE